MRLFPEIRSALIDDLNAQSPRPTLFLELYYDATEHRLPDDWRKVTRLQALTRIWRAPPVTLELFEPLWLSNFPFWVAAAATHKLRTVGARTQRVFYAIENCELQGRVPRGTRLGGLPTEVARRVVRFLISRLADKIAFGSEASQAVYADLAGPRMNTRLIPQLRASRHSVAPADKKQGTVAFVGAAHERKGLPLLLRAWEAVEDILPQGHLTIIGDGPLSSDAARWAAGRPATRTFHGRLDRADVIEILTHTAVIAVPSQRWRHWREQINAAIQEALSVGCTVVTTTETGLAPWLQAHGHTVVSPGVSAEELGAHIASALSSPLDPGAVIQSLPSRDGRVLADLWLHGHDEQEVP